jgi:hypothetical protein
MIPNLFLQLQKIPLIYMPTKCINTNYIVNICYLWHQVENFHGAILLFLVDGRGGSNDHCFLNNNVNFHPITAKIEPLDSD